MRRFGLLAGVTFIATVVSAFLLGAAWGRRAMADDVTGSISRPPNGVHYFIRIDVGNRPYYVAAAALAIVAIAASVAAVKTRRGA